jgi:hypothetical protein
LKPKVLFSPVTKSAIETKSHAKEVQRRVLDQSPGVRGKKERKNQLSQENSKPITLNLR